MQKSMVFKVLVVGFVAILMLMALSAIDGLARERKSRAHGVQEDIARSYAGRQQLIGPVVTIRYRESWAERKYNTETDTWYEEQLSRTCTRPVFPGQYTYDGEMKVEERLRGIFKAHIFQTEGRLGGSFSFPEFDELNIRKGAEVELLSVNACLLLSDLRGITRVPDFKWNGRAVAMEAGNDLGGFGEGIHAKIPDMETVFGESFDFEMELAVHGMGQFAVVPVGDENRIRLNSDWPHPSFTGDFLASERTVSGNGFAAEWNVNGLTVVKTRSFGR